MAFERAKVALASLEEKLRRQLGLAGEIGAQFTPNLQTVLIAGDLREAGNASHKGRAFAWAYVGALGTGFNGYQSLSPNTDVLIDQVSITWLGAAGVAHVYITAPDQAPAVAVATLAGSWTDRKMVATDQVPLLQGAAGVRTGVDVSDQNRIIAHVSGAAANNVYVGMVYPTNIMLPAGGALNFNLVTAAGANGVVGVRGRIWP